MIKREIPFLNFQKRGDDGLEIKYTINQAADSERNIEKAKKLLHKLACDIIGLKLEFVWPTVSNLTVRIDGLFFRGVFKPFMESVGSTYLFQTPLTAFMHANDRREKSYGPRRYHSPDRRH